MGLHTLPWTVRVVARATRGGVAVTHNPGRRIGAKGVDPTPLDTRAQSRGMGPCVRRDDAQ